MTPEQTSFREIDDKGRTVRELYRQLAERLWSPERLEREATS